MKISKSKLIILSVFICVNLWLFSTTIEINQDGSGDFITIQEGIEESADGDTVLVHPGTYIENVDMDGKDITLASLELTTGDDSYIDSTIIDGNRTGSCIKVNSYEDDVTIRGFTIQNGSGSYYGDLSGGGFFIKNIGSCHIINCKIKKNRCAAGSGIFAKDCNIILSGVSLNNNGSGLSGGGLTLWDSEISFDNNNKCSIYNNYSGDGNDIALVNISYVNIVVDTFTVMNPTRYHINYDNGCTYSISIEHNYLVEINQALFVDSAGDDNNIGTSVEEPLKTIAWAMHKIYSDQDNPKTIHIANGIYGESENNQLYPIPFKSNVNLVGESLENTILDGNWNNHTMVYLASQVSNINLTNLTFQNNHSRVGVILSIRTLENIQFSNLLIQNCTGYQCGAILQYIGLDVHYYNVTIKEVEAEDGAGFQISSFESVTMTNCNFNNCTSIGDDPINGMGVINCMGEVIIENCIFIGNALVTEEEWINTSTLTLGGYNYQQGKFIINNCLFADNNCIGTPQHTIMIDSFFDETSITNCTFVNNNSTNTITLSGDITLKNNIFNNNTETEAIVPDITSQGFLFNTNISNCDFANGQASVINQNNANNVNWLEGNIFVDPLLIEIGEDLYQLSELSPCIDTGTPDTLGLFLPPWDLLENQRVWDGDEDGIAIIDMGCYEFGAPSIVSNEPSEVPEMNKFNLMNYPNPFNPSTTISFSLLEDSRVEIEVFNVKGQEVNTLTDNRYNEGTHSVTWHGLHDSGKEASSGVYFYKFSVNGKPQSIKKMLLLK